MLPFKCITRSSCSPSASLSNPETQAVCSTDRQKENRREKPPCYLLSLRLTHCFRCERVTRRDRRSKHEHLATHTHSRKTHVNKQRWPTCVTRNKHGEINNPSSRERREMHSRNETTSGIKSQPVNICISEFFHDSVTK